MTYKIETTIRGEKGANVEEFLREVNETNQAMNESWNTIKSQLSPEEQGPGEARVREVLKA